MKLLLIATALCMVMVASAGAVIMNDSLIRSNGLNTQFNISYLTEFNGVTIDASYIYFSGLNRSNPSQSGTYALSFNVTEHNANYTGLQLPYLATNTNTTKTIVSGINTTDVTLTATVQACSATNYALLTLANGSTSAITSIACSGDDATLNLTGIQSGSNTVSFNYTIPFYTCSLEQNETLIINVFDEDTPTLPRVASVELDFTYWFNEDFKQHYSANLTGNSTYKVCTDFPSVTFDMYAQYAVAGGFTHRYYLYGETFTPGTPTNLSVYNFNTTAGLTELRITARQQSDYGYYPNVVTQLQRKYLAENVWRTVQMDQSGDFGLLNFNIKERTTDYRLVYRDTSNNVLKTTNSLKFACDTTTGVCEITQLLSPYSASTTTTALTYDYDYDASTQQLTLTWNDPLGGTSNVHMVVTKQTGAGSSTLCDTNQNGAAGTLTCDLTNVYGEVLLSVYSSASPQVAVVSVWVWLQTNKIGGIIGVMEGGLWALAIMITVLGMGLVSPAMAILSSVFGVVAIYLLGIFTPVTLTFVIIVAIIGVVIGIRVKS